MIPEQLILLTFLLYGIKSLQSSFKEREMRQPLVWLFNGTVVTITLFLFAWHMASPPQATIPQMPQPAA